MAPGLQSTGSVVVAHETSLLHGAWGLTGSGIKPVSPALILQCRSFFFFLEGFLSIAVAGERKRVQCYDYLMARGPGMLLNILHRSAPHNKELSNPKCQ